MITNCRSGTLCQIKSKKCALNTFMVLYPDLEEVLLEKNVNNSWLPSTMTDPAGVSELVLKQHPFAKPASDQFVLLEEKTDDNGTAYFKCLYGDLFGWIIGSTKSFEIVETSV